MPCSTHAVSLTPARQPGHPMFKRMYRRRAPLLALALTALSLTALVRPDGSFRLQIDSSPSAIGAAESQADFSVFAGITFDGSVRAIDIAEIAQLERHIDAAWARQDREQAFELMAALLHLDDERERRRS